MANSVAVTLTSAASDAGNAKRTPLQPPQVQPKTVALPGEDFEAIAAAILEHEQITR